MNNYVKHKITEKEYKAILEFAKTNTHEHIARKLQVLKLRYEGFSDKEIALRTNYSLSRISILCRSFKELGLEEYAKPKQTANHRNLSHEEEVNIITEFYQRADAGERVTVHIIRAGLAEKLGQKVNAKYVYNLLARHGWKNITRLKSK